MAASRKSLIIDSPTDPKKWNLLKNLDQSILSSIEWFKVFDKRLFYCTDDDRIFALGKNSCGQLGVGHTSDVSTPTEVKELNGRKVVDIVGAENITLALTQDGQVYAWGKNDDGQLGVAKLSHGYHSNQAANHCPKLIESLKNIVSITCGSEHSMALDKQGKMFIWGKNTNGQIGNKSQQIVNNFGQTANNFGQIANNSGQIVNNFGQIGNKSEQIVCNFGLIGKNRRATLNALGQIGNSLGPTQTNPIELTTFQMGMVITQIDCGAYSSVSLLNDGDVYAWGLLFGQKQQTPTKLNAFNEKIKCIACSCGGLLSLTDQGKMYIYRTDLQNPQLLQLENIQFTSLMVIDYKKFDSNQNGNFVICHSSDGQVYQGLDANGKLLVSQLSLSNTIAQHSSFQVSPFKMTIADSNLSNVGRAANLAKEIVDSFDKPDKSDLVFRFPQGEHIYGHRFFLSFFSAYMKTMLSEDWAKENAVEVTEYSYSLYHCYIKYLYTGILLDRNLDDLIGLYDLANCNIEIDLKERCLRLISKHLNAVNCCQLYEFSVQYSLVDFEQVRLSSLLGRIF